jgi:hypothetical protein
MNLPASPRLAYRQIYKALDAVKVWYEQIYWYPLKQYFAITLWFTGWERHKIKCPSQERDIDEFFEYIKMILLNEYDIDLDNPPVEKTKKREPSAFTIYVSSPPDRTVKSQKKDPVKDELDLVTNIQKHHPRLSVHDIRSLIVNYTRSEIIQWWFVRGRFIPADLYNMHAIEKDIMDTPMNGSII